MIEKLELEQLDCLPSKSFVSVEPIGQQDRALQMSQTQMRVNEQLTQRYNDLLRVVKHLTAEITDLRSQLTVSS